MLAAPNLWEEIKLWKCCPDSPMVVPHNIFTLRSLRENLARDKCHRKLCRRNFRRYSERKRQGYLVWGSFLIKANWEHVKFNYCSMPLFYKNSVNSCGNQNMYHELKVLEATFSQAVDRLHEEMNYTRGNDTQIISFIMPFYEGCRKNNISKFVFNHVQISTWTQRERQLEKRQVRDFPQRWTSMSEQKISVFLDFFSVAIILGISSNLDCLSM